MRGKVQIVFDCGDPDVLAKFYAGALRYTIQEPPGGFVSWQAYLRSKGDPSPEWVSAIVDPDGVGPRIFFQQMDTPKPPKNRLHLDLNSSSGPEVPLPTRKTEVGAEARRLIALGATKQSEFEENGEYWVVMLDPEGNEFCVQ